MVLGKEAISVIGDCRALHPGEVHCRLPFFFDRSHSNGDPLGEEALIASQNDQATLVLPYRAQLRLYDYKQLVVLETHPVFPCPKLRVLCVKFMTSHSFSLPGLSWDPPNPLQNTSSPFGACS